MLSWIEEVRTQPRRAFEGGVVVWWYFIGRRLCCVHTLLTIDSCDGMGFTLICTSKVWSTSMILQVFFYLRFYVRYKYHPFKR